MIKKNANQKSFRSFVYVQKVNQCGKTYSVSLPCPNNISAAQLFVCPFNKQGAVIIHNNTLLLCQVNTKMKQESKQQHTGMPDSSYLKQLSK